MKSALAAVGVSLLIAASTCTALGGGSSRQTAGADGAAQRTPVLVELFTSEGCSSCPPADALLAKLDQQQLVSGVEVIAMEEHVDYWDHQGWVDPFSSTQWTDRQQTYASIRHDDQVYTPQMVINGQTQFVGSRERQARQVISEAASQPHLAVTVTNAAPGERGDLQLRVTAGRLAATDSGDRPEVWLAITETGLHSDVRAGENSGVDVRHSAVVRTLRKLGATEPDKDPSFEAQPSIKVERSWKRENLRAVVFVQAKHSRRILGSAATRIAPQS